MGQGGEPDKSKQDLRWRKELRNGEPPPLSPIAWLAAFGWMIKGVLRPDSTSKTSSEVLKLCVRWRNQRVSKRHLKGEVQWDR